MSQPFEYDVLISYSTNDKAVASELAERLKADGLKVTLDPKKSQQARALVLVMSKTPSRVSGIVLNQIHFFSVTSRIYSGPSFHFWLKIANCQIQSQTMHILTGEKNSQQSTSTFWWHANWTQNRLMYKLNEVFLLNRTF